MMTTVMRISKKNLRGRAEKRREGVVRQVLGQRCSVMHRKPMKAPLQSRWGHLACSQCFKIACYLATWLMGVWCLPIILQECRFQGPHTLPQMEGPYTLHSFIRTHSTQLHLGDTVCHNQDPSLIGLDTLKGIPWAKWVSHHRRLLIHHSTWLEGCHFLTECQVQVEIWSLHAERMTWIALIRRNKQGKHPHSRLSQQCLHQVCLL